MSCKGLELVDMCMDVSGGPYIVKGTSEDTDFVNGAKAELYIGRNLLKTYTVGDGITISDYNGNPRRIEVAITDMSKSYKGNTLTIFIRPTNDVSDVMVGIIKVTDNHAKR